MIVTVLFGLAIGWLGTEFAIANDMDWLAIITIGIGLMSIGAAVLPIAGNLLAWRWRPSNTEQTGSNTDSSTPYEHNADAN